MRRGILALALWLLPSLAWAQGYPVGATPVTASATGTTTAITASLPASTGTAGAVGQTTYLCGFVVTSGGTTTAITGNVAVTGTIGGSLNFAYVFVATGQGAMGTAMPNCIPASATNTPIVVSVPAGGAGTTVAVSAWGYRL